MAAGEDPTHHWGSVIRLAPDTFALGRYFAMADARYPGHALSHLLLDSKSDPTARTTLAGIFAAIATLPLKNRSDIIATVPPAPAKSDRFAVARAALARALSAQDGALLAQRYAVTDYWHLPRSRREPTIADRFEVTSRLSGQSVLLIDDILTSGAQATACRKALKQSGAGQITTVVAAITQDVVTQLCPSCGTTEGGKVRTKRRRIDAQEFQGCTRFPICRWSRSL
jgi:hypothetical protein